MSTALKRGLWPGVDGCLSKRPTYGQCYFLTGAVDLALVTFAVEKNWPCVACPFGVSVSSCLAATRSSGSHGVIPAEPPGCEQEAAAIGGFVSRTHRGSEAVQGTAATRLMAIQVRLSWVRFTIFNFFSSAIRPDFARAPAATSRRTRAIDWIGRSRMRDRTMQFHRLAPSCSH
jgi:hypothetical protein